MSVDTGSALWSPESLDEYAWYGKNSGGKTHKGGYKKPNPFGLHDMLGNVMEYCLEPYQPPDFIPVLRGGGWDSPGDEVKASCRQPMRDTWYERDPHRPRSGWWLSDGATLGFRLVRVADASDAKEREAYASKIEILALKHEKKIICIGSSKELYVRLQGEVRNSGDRTLDELHIVAYFLDVKGKPHMMDLSERYNPTFNYAFPVLTHSAHPGKHREPLKPGQVRGFMVDIPQSWGWDDEVPLDKFGARVVGLVFARE